MVPCLHQDASDVSVLFVKSLQAVHLITHALSCMYVRSSDENLKIKICDG